MLLESKSQWCINHSSIWKTRKRKKERLSNGVNTYIRCMLNGVLNKETDETVQSLIYFIHE